MEEENTNLSSGFDEVLGESFMEFLLPKLIPQLEPVSNQIKKVLGNDEKRIMLQIVGGELVLFVIETDGIIEMEIKEDKFKSYPLDKYKDMLLNGGVEKLIEEMKAK